MKWGNFPWVFCAFSAACNWAVVVPVLHFVYICLCVCVCVPSLLVSLCPGWWKLVKRATQRKGFTWAKLCWRTASSTTVSVSVLLLLPLRPVLSSSAVPHIKSNLPQYNLLCAAQCRACKCLQFPDLTSTHIWRILSTVLSLSGWGVGIRCGSLIYFLAGVPFKHHSDTMFS